MKTRTSFPIAACLIGMLAVPAAQSATHDSLLADYRSGAREKAILGLLRLSLAVPDTDEISKCLAHPPSRTRDELEAELMLHSEVTFSAWSDDSQGPAGLARLGIVRAHLRVVNRAHDALKQKDPQSKFLYQWYLLWESFRQSDIYPFMGLEPDYLQPALQAFPKDARLLLAAGSRDEMGWWGAADNPQRHPTGAAGSSEQHLRGARNWLRASVAADPALDESRLRLGRVLQLLGDLTDAEEQLRRFQGASEDPAFQYLGHLFLGDLYERRGDSAAAAAAYQAAIPLVAVAQSARIAAAHLAYAASQREAAAAGATKAITERATGSDPWWWYLRGQFWRFESYRSAARALVRPPGE